MYAPAHACARTHVSDWAPLALATACARPPVGRMPRGRCGPVVVTPIVGRSCHGSWRDGMKRRDGLRRREQRAATARPSASAGRSAACTAGRLRASASHAPVPARHLVVDLAAVPAVVRGLPTRRTLCLRSIIRGATVYNSGRNGLYFGAQRCAIRGATVYNSGHISVQFAAQQFTIRGATVHTSAWGATAAYTWGCHGVVSKRGRALAEAADVVLRVTPVAQQRRELAELIRREVVRRA
jgi:hypothetical protein